MVKLLKIAFVFILVFTFLGCSQPPEEIVQTVDNRMKMRNLYGALLKYKVVSGPAPANATVETSAPATK